MWQKEKASLALVCKYKRFHIFIYGRPVLDEIDHKLLIAVAKKVWQTLPLRTERAFFLLQI